MRTTTPAAVPFAGIFAPVAQMGETLSGIVIEAIRWTADVRRRMEAQRQCRKTEMALRVLSDATLKDIGVPRCQITEIAHRSAFADMRR